MCCADIPYAWVNLRHGVGAEELTVQETNTAAVGSFTLEFGLLSRLTGQKHVTTIHCRDSKLRFVSTGCHVPTHGVQLTLKIQILCRLAAINLGNQAHTACCVTLLEQPIDCDEATQVQTRCTPADMDL